MVDRVRPFTMVAHQSLIDLSNQVRVLLASGVKGDFVECGVWKGGAAFLMADLLRQAGEERKVWLFDSFEGLPPPTNIDGAAAKRWATRVSSPSYRDNLRISIDRVHQTALELGLGPHTELVKGWFEQSLPANRERIGPIALLRIDADWHASVLCCLENLFDQVVDGGLLIFDDYYTWSGCTVAVHQFLGARGLGFPIEGPLGACCGMPAIIRKGDITWHELWQGISALDEIRRRKEDLAGVIRPEQAFILVGQDAFGDTIPSEWRVIPFLEKDGVYWGLPEDDVAAIRELTRLRGAGADFIVFSSSAFWWLEYYQGFAQYLNAHGRRLQRNERLILYDLRCEPESGAR